MPAPIDDVLKKHGFKQLNVATWRDPSLSVLSARGGPKSPTISPDAAGKPFVPTYKFNLSPLPESANDGESQKDDEGDAVDTQRK